MEKNSTSELVIQFIALLFALGVVSVLGSYSALLMIGIALLLLAVKKTTHIKARKFLWPVIAISFTSSIAIFLFNFTYMIPFPVKYYPAPVEPLMWDYFMFLIKLRGWELMSNWLIP